MSEKTDLSSVMPGHKETEVYVPAFLSIDEPEDLVAAEEALQLDAKVNELVKQGKAVPVKYPGNPQTA